MKESPFPKWRPIAALSTVATVYVGCDGDGTRSTLGSQSTGGSVVAGQGGVAEMLAAGGGPSDPMSSGGNRGWSGSAAGGAAGITGAEAGSPVSVWAGGARQDAGVSGSGTGDSDAGLVDVTNLRSGEWRSYGHDLLNTRHNPQEHRIGVENVDTLTLKWSWDEVAVTSTPVHHGGNLYFGDLAGYVVALDANTGEQRWRVPAPMLVTPVVSGSAFATEEAVFIDGDNAMLYA